MYRYHLDQALEPIAGRFNAEILAKGEDLERTLGPDQKRLLDELDGMHFRRSGALVVASFDLGIEVGKAFSAHRLRQHLQAGGP